MCKTGTTKQCTSESCKTLGTLMRLKKAQKGQNSKFGRWAYNSEFITQLMAQKKDTSSNKRRNRKMPSQALELYKENQRIIEQAHDYPIAKTA